MEFQIAPAWRHVNAGFLLALVVGMGLLWIASQASWPGCSSISRSDSGHSFRIDLCVGGIRCAFGQQLGLDQGGPRACEADVGALVSNAGGLPASEHPAVTFAAGAVAICAWILPGVSGSFMLLLLGQYQHVIRSIAALDLLVIGSLAAGCLVGLALFTRALAWLLRVHFASTLAFLCGFMVRSCKTLALAANDQLLPRLARRCDSGERETDRASAVRGAVR